MGNNLCLKILTLVCLKAAALWSQDFDKVFVLENSIELQQDEKNLLGSVRDCFIDPVGIIVCDSKSGEVKIYEASGKFKSFLGRRGRGPGEFIAPLAVYATEDRIYVNDVEARRLSIFDKPTLKFLNHFLTLDGREMRVVSDRIYLSYPNLESHTTIHVFDKDGKKLQDFGTISEIAMANQLISDLICFDYDRAGNWFSIQEMEYTIFKFDPAGKLLRSFPGKTTCYTPPPREPFKAFYSKEKTTNWLKSWSHLIGLRILRNSQKIIINMSRPSGEKNDYCLDIWDAEGKPVYQGISTHMLLLFVDRNDHVYFLDEEKVENSVVFRIKEFTLSPR